MHHVRGKSCMRSNSGCHAPPHWAASASLTLAQHCFVISCASLLHMWLVNLSRLCNSVQDAYRICCTRIHLQWVGCNKRMSLLQWHCSCAWQGTRSRGMCTTRHCFVQHWLHTKTMHVSIAMVLRTALTCMQVRLLDDQEGVGVRPAQKHWYCAQIWINVNWYELCQLYTFQHDTLCLTGLKALHPHATMNVLQ